MLFYFSISMPFFTKYKIYVYTTMHLNNNHIVYMFLVLITCTVVVLVATFFCLLYVIDISPSLFKLLDKGE